MIDKENMKEGWYYSQEKHGVEICHWDSDHEMWDSIFGSDEVLAPVPSYEEWKKAYECVVSENEEITTLKELLKECKQMLMSSNYENIAQYHEVLELRDKIDEVLKC